MRAKQFLKEDWVCGKSYSDPCACEALTEATQKGRDYNHLEDLVTFEGSKGALQAASILQRLGQDSKDVSIKWDGNTTLFWGREPDGTFVITGKNGW